MNTSFASRHIGPRPHQKDIMLQDLGLSSLEELADQTLPPSIRLQNLPWLPEPLSEADFLAEMRGIASRNRPLRSCLGQGYYGTYMPAVVQRNILENPGWYTAYTPYQAEISQGRLEMLFLFQSALAQWMELPLVGASLLDEATAAAECMTMFLGHARSQRKAATIFAVCGEIFPQTLAVLRTRAWPLGVEVRCFSPQEKPWEEDGVFGLLVQNPDNHGKIHDLHSLVTKAEDYGIPTVLATDLLASALLQTPGSIGFHAAVGSTQRCGLPMGDGGPHAGWLACREIYKRLMPGRIIGLSKDSAGRPAFRMALQTREQHIRREKATSNICTSQVFPAILSTAWMMHHGCEGIVKIAEEIHKLAGLLATSLSQAGYNIAYETFFDTVCVINFSPNLPLTLQEGGYMVRVISTNVLTISLDETWTASILEDFLKLFSCQMPKTSRDNFRIAGHLRRSDKPWLSPAPFHNFRSEQALQRFLKSLENRDISLTHSMIPLGSCTMKLNGAAEMLALSLPAWMQTHPFAPPGINAGNQELSEKLEQWLASLTGFAAVSLQPNSGAQGEYAGLLAIRSWQHDRGQKHRNIALIPASAHGTNPASAALCGLECVVVHCDNAGNIDIEDLREKIHLHSNNLCVLMITYPSTHGVFEEMVGEICEMTHAAGGQVYMDGANLNAQVGLTSPGFIGADICHLNLHKTFAIPHGGGGPGSGPIGVAAHLIPHLPGHPILGSKHLSNTVSAAPRGSGSILAISYGYIRMMGMQGLRDATLHAILNANWLMEKLAPHYPILYRGSLGRCAHEFIVDCRQFKKSANVEVEDIAKRLMDYGFHAPTVSFPVPGTLMIEPTESEPLEELDRFAQAMIAIRREISCIENGEMDRENNWLKGAPHCLTDLLGEWNRPYSRQSAAHPLPWLEKSKIWPSVSRIDNAHGDRSLICSCAGIEEYQ